MKKILLCIALFIPVLLSAQTKKQPALKPYSADEAKDAKKDGDAALKALNYTEAIKIFDRLVVTEPNNGEYNYKLGICYLNTNLNKAKAVAYMEYAANANTKDKPKDITFDLGKAYLYAGLYDKANETFEKFRIEKKGTVDAKLKFEQWVNWATNAKAITATQVPATFENLGKAINSAWADYHPVIGASDTVVYFSSKRKGNTGGLVDDFGDIPSDIYMFTQNDSGRTKPKNLGVNVNTNFYDEALFVNAAGNRMLIYQDGFDCIGDLRQAELKGKQWDKPVMLGKDFVTKAQETGATLSPDGLTVYFAAEAEGSKTGKDIYRCTRTESTTWGKPERLGDNINTKADEDAPYLWLDGKTLFFSSTGHNSMGGYDIFKSIMKSPSEGFSKAENIGAPLNTVYDDLAMAVAADGKTLYMSAVRDSGFGDFDLYKVTLTTPITAAPMVYIQGSALTSAGTPAKGAFVVITSDVTGETVANTTTNDATGRFDAAVPAGSYKVTLRHAKLGKAEASFTADPATTGKVTIQVQFQ